MTCRLIAPLLLPALLLLPACDKEELCPGSGAEAGDGASCDDAGGDTDGGGTDGTPTPDAGDGSSCDTPEEARPCANAPKMIQYCTDSGEWGTCFDPAEACTLGDRRSGDCGLDLGIDNPETCRLDYDGIPRWDADDPEACNTPLVLVPEGRAPVFLPDPLHTFAVSASTCITTDWPTADTPWLARDLDGNGAIDGGHELFGNGTDVAGHRARNGFAALAPLDHNGDGRVDAEDPAFFELVLWADRDGDRRSTPDELTPLADAGVRALPLAYTLDPACDDRGNCARERAAVIASVPASLVDVYLPCR